MTDKEREIIYYHVHRLEYCMQTIKVLSDILHELTDNPEKYFFRGVKFPTNIEREIHTTETMLEETKQILKDLGVYS